MNEMDKILCADFLQEFCDDKKVTAENLSNLRVCDLRRVMMTKKRS